MRVHQLDDAGLIFNTIEVESLDAFLGTVDASIGGTIGDSVIDRVVVKRQPPPLSKEEINAPILIALAALDAKSIRPLRDGDVERLEAIEVQAAALRLQLVK